MDVPARFHARNPFGSPVTEAPGPDQDHNAHLTCSSKNEVLEYGA